MQVVDVVVISGMAGLRMEYDMCVGAAVTSRWMVGRLHVVQRHE
jgi:hypothetical protein